MVTNISKLFAGLATVAGGEGFCQASVENQFTANALLLSVGPTAAQDVQWSNLLSFSIK